MYKKSLLILILCLQFTVYIDAQVFEKQNISFPAVAWGDIAYADFDLDGDDDLLLTGRNEQNLAVSKIYRNDNGQFVDINANIENVMLSSVAWADLNNDKYPEIILTGKNNKKENITYVYRNWQNGTFSKVNTEIIGVSTGSVACADYDKDGDIDLLICGSTNTGDICKIYANDGYFKFTDTKIPLKGIHNSDACWADFNNDKYPDFIVSGESGNEKITKIYLNNNNKSFTEIETEIPQLGNSAIACADLNNDKNIDILISGLDKNGNEKTNLFINNGNLKLTDINKARSFKLAAYSLPNVAYGTVNLFDLDADKDLDIVITGKGQVKIAEIYLNEGNFNFKKTNSSLTGIYNSAVAIFDANKNGIPDILATGLTENDQITSVYYKNKNVEIKKTEVVQQTTNIESQKKQSVYFPEREQLIINTEALNTIKQYEKLINELGMLSSGNEEKVTDLKEQIINLFLNRQVAVYNDLDPTHTKSKLKEIDTYTSDLVLLYPDGISISVDRNNARMTSIKQHSKNLYSVDIVSNKRIDGNYMNRTLNANTERLSFRIAFNKEKNSFTNFKFVGIREAGSLSFVQDEKALEEINKIELSPTQAEQIDNACAALLNDYIRNLSLIGNPNEDPDDKVLYEQAFAGLFSNNETLIFNDIDPEVKEKSFQAGNYIKQYRTLYPNGINNIHLNIDSAQFKPTLKADDDTYYRYVYADKNFSGNYKGKQKHSTSENLVFKVVFSKEANSFQNFKISNIEQSSLSFYETASLASADTATHFIKSIGRKGLSGGLTTTIGMGSVYDKNLLNEEIGGTKIYSHKPSIGFSAGVDLNYFFTDNLSFCTGLIFSSYKSEYSIADGNYSDEPITSQDPNSEDLYRNITANNFKLSYKASTLSIPLHLQWISSKPRQIGFYLRGGLNLSIPLKVSSQMNGDLQYFGEYPNNPESIRLLYLTELGFYNINGDNQSVEINSSPFFLSADLSAGVNLPIGYFLTLKAGPELVWGLTDIYNDETATNIFGEEVTSLKTTLRNYGFNISVIYKF